MSEESKKIFHKKIEGQEKVLDERVVEDKKERKEPPFEKSMDGKIIEAQDSDKDSLQNALKKVSTDSHPLQKTADLVEIESILSQGIENIYDGLSPEKQWEFKKKGEETALKISLLLQKTKVKVKNIIKLIKDWLKIIPGINKFFLEQEAKIKADKLLNLKK